MPKTTLYKDETARPRRYVRITQMSGSHGNREVVPIGAEYTLHWLPQASQMAAASVPPRQLVVSRVPPAHLGCVSGYSCAV